MQLLKGRVMPADQALVSPVPLRKVLVMVPVRVNHGDCHYMLLNVMQTSNGETVDVPHVWLEVPETAVMEESRTMAIALLS